MASSLKNLSSYDEKNLASAADLKFGIVVSDWNTEITHALYEGCYDTLIKHGAKEDNIFTAQVPGTFELPVGAKMLLKSTNADAVICLGCVIKGDTEHDQYINQSVANGITQLSIMSGKPIIFGVLTVNDKEQAEDRAGGKYGNKGVESAITAIKMVSLQKDLSQPKGGSIGF